MNQQEWGKAQALCLAAEDLPSSEQRAFLEQRCEGDTVLLEQVLSMLESVNHTQGILDRSMLPVLEAGAKPEASELLNPASSLGPWKIGGLVGRGGMGEVYEAYRADGAFELRAAVKLLKRGLDTDSVVRRFLRERRILAQLAHPNIGHLLDAGVSPDGRPYLVMEFVAGLPITHYASSKALPTRELLRLFLTVCDAVQVAHAKHIVHRDLKPSNVMVTADGQVKLLDFGIAKLLDDESDEQTRMSGDATPFTPEYAAPEQILGAEATPASDVYSLGIILMELLTERLPHARRGRSATEIALALPKETIERPSVLLRRERGRLPEPLRLARLREISRDLDLIALKAMHVDQARRYGTAQELADDLHRLINLQPVRARPDSRGYRIARFVRRNQLMVLAVTAVVAALAIGMAGALWQAHAATRARNEALRHKQQAEELLQFMLGDLRDKLLPIGKLSILDAVGSKAMDYFSKLDQKDRTDRALGSQATALRQIGDLRIKQGNMSGAMEAFVGALSLDEELLKRHPNDTAFIHNVGESEFSLGYAYYATGRIAPAKPWLERYVRTARRLTTIEPGNQEWQHVLVQANQNLAAVTYAAGDLLQARALFSEALAAHRKLVEAEPDQLDYLPTLAELHGWLHAIDAAEYDWPSALSNAGIESDIYRRLLKQQPEDAGYRHELTQAILRMIADELHLRTVTADSPALLEALQLSAQLTQLDRDNIEYLHSRLVALRILTDTQLSGRQFEAAAHTSEQQLALARTTYRRAPTKSQAVNDLLASILQKAKLEIVRQQLPQARVTLADAEIASLDDEQQASISRASWLDLSLLKWWLSRGQPQEAVAAERSRDAVKSLLASGVPPDPELMFRYRAQLGELSEAQSWWPKMEAVKREHLFLKRFCLEWSGCRNQKH